MPKKLAAVILAAGQGTRMKSALPKVLHPVAGKSMLSHVVQTARALDAAPIVPVIGHGAELVRSALADENLTFAIQAEQLGTGHALQCAETSLKGFTGDLLLSVAMSLCFARPPCGSYWIIIAKTRLPSLF